MLRQEVYAEDKTAQSTHPYQVTEQNFGIEVIQSQQQNSHAVFFVHPQESLTYHYERNSADPRIGHEMVLQVDRFGNVLQSVSIAYPRRLPRYPEQEKTHIIYTENQITNKPNEQDWYRIGVPIATRTYEITGLPKLFPYSWSTLRTQLETATEVSYETITEGATPQKRLIESVRSRYRANAEANTLDPTPLPWGEVESLALPCESFKLAFTPGLLAQVYGNKTTLAELNTLLSNEGKYRQEDGNWWIPSGRQTFDPDGFYFSLQMKDPFGGIYRTTYDRYHLLVVETKDALPVPQTNIVQIRNDYRVLQPQQITDANGDRFQVAFDALGMVAGTAVMGKITETKGDLLEGFKADLTQAEIDTFLANPLVVAHSLLGNGTTRIIYDLEQFKTDGQPVVAATITREIHLSDLPLGTPSKVQISFSYSDGFGREIQKKIQAEAGEAPERVSNANHPNRPGKLILESGKPKLVPTISRWVGNGRTIFNNKGKPVKQYEPFFSSTHLYEDETEMVMTGVTPILFYDPLDRVVATLHPNHVYEKVVFNPWQQATWDSNDTVLLIDPKTDPDVGEFFRRLPEQDYLPTWYSRANTSAIASEKDAAQKALAHANTPAIAHLDTLGRTFLTIADNGGVNKYETRITLDIEGNTILVTDARNNEVMVYAIAEKDAQGKSQIIGRAFDLLGHNLYSHSMDAGDRWILNNVAGQPIRAWNNRETRYDVPESPRGHIFRTVYDALQRPTHLYVQPAEEPEILTERLVYGEIHPQAQQRNLKGKPFHHYDGAGVVSNWEFDFKGNLLRGSRQLAREYKQPVNWMVLANLTEIAQVGQAAIALLEPRTFDTLTTFDALNRPISLTTPDQSIIYPILNEANLLEKVEVKLRGATTRTTFVSNINYDAKGQRQLIEYGNGVNTEYRYDPQTFRLIQLLTTRIDNNQAIRLQNLNYTYDPVGNITTIRDDSQQTNYFNGEVVSPSTQYQYDALYRLISASGREHIGQTTQQPPETRSDLKPHYDSNDWTRRNLPHPNDGQAMRNYTETYKYDGVGNILAMIHQAMGGGWTRNYDYEASNNRLRTTSLPGDGNDVKLLPSRYKYDLHGNMIQMPHLPLMQWDFKDQLQATSQQVRNDGGKPEITYFVYDASGQRVRKITERQADAGQIPTRRKERIYLGGFEIYREYNGDGTTVNLERETLHIMDDQQRIALVETRTQGNDDSPLQLIRYQLGNHLGSASLELSDQGAIVSYEEYYPYGSTSYQGGRSVAEVGLKRYRYTGKERDGETGLYYHGARYYAAWLGRWVSCDPIGIGDGLNLYIYVKNKPVKLIDDNGMDDSAPPQQSRWDRFKSFAGIAGSIIKQQVTEVITGPPGSPPIRDFSHFFEVRGHPARQAFLAGQLGIPFQEPTDTKGKKEWNRGEDVNKAIALAGLFGGAASNLPPGGTKMQPALVSGGSPKVSAIPVPLTVVAPAFMAAPKKDDEKVSSEHQNSEPQKRPALPSITKDPKIFRQQETKAQASVRNKAEHQQLLAQGKEPTKITGKVEIHHVASDKAEKTGWTAKLKILFDKAGMNIKTAKENLVSVEGHGGSHGPDYNRLVYNRLLGAVTDKNTGQLLTGQTYKDALINELLSLKRDILTKGSMWNDLVTKK